MVYDTKVSTFKQLGLPPAPLSKRLTNAIGILKERGAKSRREIREMRRGWGRREKRRAITARRSSE